MKAARLTRIASEVVSAVQGELPVDVAAVARAVPVHLEAAPGAETAGDADPQDLLGLFVGTPHGEALAADSAEPPRIFLYMENLWDYAGEEAGAFRDEVRTTYLHELGHAIGWDEDQVAGRGLD